MALTKAISVGRFLSAIAAALLALAPARPLAAERKPKVPKLELQLPGLPALDDVKSPTEPAPLPAEEEPRPAPALEKIEHARGFDADPRGRRPLGPLFRRIELIGFPARIDAFKSLLRVRSPGGRPLHVRLHLEAPDGTVLRETEADVSFAYGTEVRELVVDWETFDASAAGTYAVVVRWEETELGRGPFELSEKPAPAAPK